MCREKDVNTLWVTVIEGLAPRTRNPSNRRGVVEGEDMTGFRRGATRVIRARTNH